MTVRTEVAVETLTSAPERATEPSAFPMSATPWSDRPHLDGLRAIAVYAVVCYHAGLSQFSGGFIGVDLFFVLSGYLVTMVLLTDLASHGRVRLVRFYARRARRLVPAAAFAVVGTAIGSVLVASLVDRATIVGDATASSLWFANWHFLAEANDYFNADGPESPFLHFWSLSIEEQFYLGFPLVLVATWRLTRRFSTVVGVIVALMVVSLSLQLAYADSVNRAYLGTDTRVYQILVGALLATMFWRRHVAGEVAERPRLGRGVQVAGLVLVAGFVLASTPALAVSVSNRGLIAALVSVGLIAALETGGRCVLTNGLSWRPVRFLGQISYGTYLWHWPILVLALDVVEMSPVAALVFSAVGGTAMAALSAELVERPIRFNTGLDRAPRYVIAAGVALALVTGALLAPALLRWDRRPVVASSSNASIGAGVPAEPIPDVDWTQLAREVPDVPPCNEPNGSDCYVAEASSGTILLMGDSHSRMLLPAFTGIAEARDMSLAIDYGPGCPWQRDLFGERGGDKTKACVPRREATYETRIDAIDPDLIVVAGFPNSIETRGGISSPRPEWQDLDREGLVAAATDAALAELASHGVPVLVVEPVPLLTSDPLSCLSAAATVSECVIESRDEGSEEPTEREIAATSSLISTVDLDPIVCPREPACDPLLDGVVVRRDPHHFTIEFARTLTPVFERAVGRALDGA